jgi:tetratricopeptide (TPR) repeat protein
MPAPADRLAESYVQFLMGRHYEGNGEGDLAIAAYKRAMELDPGSAEVPAELAGLYLRQSRLQEAMEFAEKALKIDAENREANRVLGIIYAALADERDASRGRNGAPGTANENVTKAIRHLEVAIERSPGEVEPSLRATLGRMYVAGRDWDKAIALLVPLVNQEPQWSAGPELLAEAYAGAGRIRDGIVWLKERADQDPRLLPTLADFYERERDWQSAADTYALAIKLVPFGRNTTDLRTRHASALLNVRGRAAAEQARDTLMGPGMRGVTPGAAKPTLPNDARALYLLSQAQRRLGDGASAEAAARALIALNAGVPWGYYALAEALEARGQYQAVVDALAPVMDQFRPRNAGDPAYEATMLLPHLGFAYQQLGQFDKAIETFEEARRLAPKDTALAAYLVEANIAAREYRQAVEIARAASAAHPDDARLQRVHALALRRDGRAAEAVELLQGTLTRHADDPAVHIALAGAYGDASRPDDAVRTLQTAQAKFPSEIDVLFELGATFDRQQRYPEAETAFKQVLSRDPENADALNYLGYMLAERGERLDESVTLLKKALELEPENGAFLDSLGWAYYKANNLPLAESHLRRAADQLRTNSVIQDHYGDVLFKLQRFDAAIAAWTRALDGDGDSIDREDIDKKIRAARQQLQK